MVCLMLAGSTKTSTLAIGGYCVLCCALHAGGRTDGQTDGRTNQTDRQTTHFAQCFLWSGTRPPRLDSQPNAHRWMDCILQFLLISSTQSICNFFFLAVANRNYIGIVMRSFLSKWCRCMSAHTYWYKLLLIKIGWLVCWSILIFQN